MLKLLRLSYVFLLLLFLALAVWLGSLGYDQQKLYLIPILVLLWCFDMFREVIFFFGSLTERAMVAKKRLEDLTTNYYPKVSIIMPAYNEEVCLSQALGHMYTLDYPDYEIVFVDDGSSDSTLVLSHEIASRNPHVPTQIVSQPNGGKSKALNTGIIHANGDLVMCVDTDSKIDPQSIRAGVSHFQDQSIVAVGGFVSVANRGLWITEIKHFEYLLAIQFSRRAFSLFGAVTVVPGPIGMFRKSALLEMGGYNVSGKAFAEDAELTIRMLSQGWKIVSDERMISVTEAPETYNAFFRQRYRWIRGMYQATWDNLPSYLFKKGWREFFLGIHLLYESTMAPIFTTALTLVFLSSFFTTGDTFFFGIWFFYTLVVECIRTVMTAQSKRDVLAGTLGLIPRKIFLTYVLQTWAFFCLLDEWLGQGMSWDKLERTGNLGGAA